MSSAATQEATLDDQRAVNADPRELNAPLRRPLQRRVRRRVLENQVASLAAPRAVPGNGSQPWFHCWRGGVSRECTSATLAHDIATTEMPAAAVIGPRSPLESRSKMKMHCAAAMTNAAE